MTTATGRPARTGRGVVLITGVGRRRGLGAAIALGLAADGHDLILNHWAPYDARLGLERDGDDTHDVAAECRARGVRVEVVSGDLADPDEPARLVAATAALGPVRGAVLSHCESVDSHTLDTTVDSWDRHFAVNARAAWLLLRALAEHLPAAPTTEAVLSVVALTSDHTAFNLPYGASKGALDRTVIAAAIELGGRGLRANVLNPGPIDTGWMTPGLARELTALTPTGRLGTPADTADLVRFLFSDAGGWVTAQVLHSNGGFHAAG